MSEEAQDSATATDQPIEVSDDKQKTDSKPPEKSGKEKPEGWDEVELTPDQQKRFNRVYGQVKSLERQIKERDTILQDQYSVIEELRQGQNKIVNFLQEGDYKSAEDQLKTQRQAAYEKGDWSAVDEINDKLQEIKLEKRFKSLETTLRPKDARKPATANEAVNSALSAGKITPEDAAAYQAWVNETDDNGNPIRPWLQQSDFRNQAAVVEGQAVFRNPVYSSKTFAEKLQEIDSRMGVVNKKPQAQVLGAGNLDSNLTKGSKNPTVRLTDNQERWAVATQFAGKGKSREDHLEAYKKQVAEAKGARK